MNQMNFGQFLIVFAIYSLGIGVAFIYDAATRNRVTNMIWASWLYLMMVGLKKLLKW